MPNIYDQFDTEKPGGNVYDQFDSSGSGKIKNNIDNGYLSEIGRGLEHGALVTAPKMVGDAAKFFGFHDIGNEIVKSAQSRETPSNLESAAGQAEKSPFSVRGNVYEAADNAVMSTAPGAAGAATGALAGSFIPGLGTAVGALAGYAIGSIASLPIFYGSQGEQSYEKVKQAQLDAGASPEVAESEARKAAHLSGSIEAGGELVSDIIPFGALAKPFSKPAVKAAGNVVRSTLFPTIKAGAKTVLKTVGGEVATEMAQQAGEAEVEGAYGAGPGATWDDAASVMMPTALMSVIPGMAGAGAKRIQSSRDVAKLVNPETPPEERAKIALGAASVMEKVDPESARSFSVYAIDKIKQNEKIDIHGDEFYKNYQESETPEDRQSLALEYKPDPLISFPDGSVGRRADVESYINQLPENERIPARAKLLGYGQQTIADIGKAGNIDDAIKAFEGSVSSYPDANANDILTKAAEEGALSGLDKPSGAVLTPEEIQAQERIANTLYATNQQSANQELILPNGEAQSSQVIAPTQSLLNAQLDAIRKRDAGILLTSEEAALARLPVDGGMQSSIIKADGNLSNRTLGVQERLAIADQDVAAERKNLLVTPVSKRNPETAVSKDGGSQLSNNPASWVIKEKSTGAAVMETFDRKRVDALNTEKYEAVPIYDYLVGLNKNSNKTFEPASTGIKAERRQDIAKRKSVSEMTPDEMRKALLTDDITGLGNRRAYNESVKKPYQASLDIDSLKWVNDNLGHEAGDKLIQSLGKALKEEGIDAYHLSGDEFAAQFDNDAVGSKALERVRNRLKEATITAVTPDGTVITKKGVEFSHGIAKTIEDADGKLRADKSAREASGQRASRGAEPSGVARKSAARNEDNGRKPATEKVSDTKKVPTQKKIKESKSAEKSFTGNANLTAEQVAKSISGLKSKWLGFTNINVVQSLSDLPKNLQSFFSSKDDSIEGFYDPESNSVYLVADNLSSVERAAWVASHEVVGHGGLRMLQDKSINEALKVAGANRFIKNLATAISGERGDVEPSVAVEEAIAELAAAYETGSYKEIFDRYGVNIPTSAMDGIRGSIARIIQAIRRFLFAAIGKPLSETSDFDVLELIANLRSVVSKGGANSKVGNQGTFDANNPSILYSKAPKLPDWLKQMPKETQEAAKKAGIWQEQEPLKNRLLALRDKAIAETQQGLFDQFAPLTKLGEREYVLARLTKSADAPLEAVLLYGKPFLNKAGAVDVNIEKGGLVKVLQQLNGEQDRFFAWMAGNRASKLKAEGRENLFSNQDISALKSLNTGQMDNGKSRAMLYEKVRMEFNGYSRSVMDIAEKAGIINGADRSIWESDFYVPFYRVLDDAGYSGPKNVSGMVNQYAFKKLKGGTDNLNDLLANTLKNWSHLLSASLKNQAATAALNTAEKASIAVPIGTKQKGSVTILEQGKEKHYMIEDPFIMDAITSLEWAGWNNPAMKWMTKAKHYLTLGVTISPTFKVRNLIRDQISAIGLNPVSYNMLNNLSDGWKGTDKDSQDYARMLTGGGLMRFGTFLEDDRASHTKRLVNSGVKEGTILDTKEKVWDFFKSKFDWWQEVGDRSENITRAAIYKQRYEQAINDGLDDDNAHLLASFAARDSMDFSLQGKWGSIRFLAQLVPFLNARLQGLYKLGKDGINPAGRMLMPQIFGDKRVGDKAKAMRFGAVTGTVALASIALMLAYSDDDDWKNREEWDRDAYWWFKWDGIAYRIPKPFEIGAIGTMAERGLETAMNGFDKESRKLFAERLWSTITQTFAMNPTPQLIKPLIDLYANTDSFTGRPIESEAMERLSKSERIGQNTSAVAQLVGKASSKVNLSPAQVDHLVDGYFAWLGTHLVMTVDFALRPLMGLPDKPAYRFPTDYFVIGDFAKNLPADQSKYVTKFYEQSKEVQQKMADIRFYQNIGNLEKARELMSENKDSAQLSRMYEYGSKQLSEINKRIKITQASNLSSEEKRENIDRLTQARVRITKSIEERRADLQKQNQE